MLGELLNVINRFFILFNLKIVNPYLLSFWEVLHQISLLSMDFNVLRRYAG